MRRAIPVLILLSLLLPFTTAQETPDANHITDPEGDVDGNVPSDDAYTFIDITEASVWMDGGTLDLTVDVADLAPAAVLTATSADYWLELGVLDEEFAAVIHYFGVPIVDPRVSTEPQESVQWTVFRQDGDTWTPVSTGQAGHDGNRLNASIPYTTFQSGAGETPGAGTRFALHAIHSYWDDWASSYHETDEDPGVYGRDQAAFPADAELRIPGTSSSTLSLSTTNPVRHTNGEATTYHWSVRVASSNPSPLEGLVSVSTDAGFDVRHPAAIQVPGEGSAVLDVFVTTPFNHQHGTEDVVTVSIDTTEGQADLDLAIRYLDVPQPAGHHSTVYLHTDGQRTWMNTLQEDSPAGAYAPPSGGICTTDGESTTGAIWSFPLDPPLLIGLESPGGTVTLDGQIEVDGTLPPGRLLGLLHVYDAQQGEPNGIGTPSFEVVVDQPIVMDSLPLPSEFPFPEALQAVAPAPNQNLAFSVLYCPDGDAVSTLAAAQAVQEGATMGFGTMHLPLDEYRDPIQFEFREDSVQFTGTPDTPERAAPGANVLWTPVVENASGTYDISLLGLHAAEAQLHGPASIDVSPGDSKPVPVSLEVPDLSDGDVAEVVVYVTNKDDPTDSAALRLVAIVDSTSELDHHDQIEALQGSSQASPLAPFHLLLLALAAIGLRRSRQSRLN